MQVSRACINNCIPQWTVLCSYLSIAYIHASGAKVLSPWFVIFHCNLRKLCRYWHGFDKSRWVQPIAWTDSDSKSYCNTQMEQCILSERVYLCVLLTHLSKCAYALVNLVNIGLGICLSPVRRRTGDSHYQNQCWLIINWDLRKKLQWNLNKKYISFHSWKCVWKYRLRNGDYTVQRKISYRIGFYSNDTFSVILYEMIGICFLVDRYNIISCCALKRFFKKTHIFHSSKAGA